MQWSFCFCMLVSSIVIEIKIFLIDQILYHFMCNPVYLLRLTGLFTAWKLGTGTNPPLCTKENR
jgi:hypothetical protein